MRTIFSAAPRGARVVSDVDWIPLSASIRGRPDRLINPVSEDELAYSFYALLDDAELREVFGSFSVPADGSD